MFIYYYQQITDITLISFRNIICNTVRYQKENKKAVMLENLRIKIFFRKKKTYIEFYIIYWWHF